MKKVLTIVLAIALVAGIFTGFALPSRAREESVGEETVLEDDVYEEETHMTGEEEPDAAQQSADGVSPTTGLPGSSEFRGVIVQIDNASAARPQSGIQSADVVYETPGEVDDLDTRLTALFNDAITNAAEGDKLTAGSVRSSRYYHQWIQAEWDAIYVHQGGPDKTGNSESDIWGASSEHIKQRITGAGRASHSELFFQNDRGDSLDAFAMTDVIADAEIYDYEPQPLQAFKFSSDQDLSAYPEVSSVKLSFISNPGWVEYRYDAEKGKMIRYMSDKEITDKNTGEAVEIQNVIVQYVATGTMPDDFPRRKLDVTGEGPAEFYINGRHLTGTWERPTYEDRTVYKLDSGEELELTPGNTWIAMHPNNTSVVTTYADGSESVTNSKEKSTEEDD